MARTLTNIKIEALVEAILNNGVDSEASTARTAQVKQGKDFEPATALATGTSANQADRVWADEGRTLTSGNSESIDVYDLGSIDIGAGAGKDALGQTWAVAEIVAVLIHNRASSAGDITFGGEGTGATWNSMFNASDSAKMGPLAPGGIFLWFDPTDPALAVADSSNHLLEIDAVGGNVTYDIVLIGRSA